MNESTALERLVLVIHCWGEVGGGGQLALRAPTLALSFHSGKNIYLFGPCGGFLTLHESLRNTDQSQIKPIMKQR